MSPTPEQLQDGANHLGYEWAILLGVRLTDWHKIPSANPLERLVNEHGRTEITLLHARIIFEFLFGPAHHDDDVNAAHYLKGSVRDTWTLSRAVLAATYCPSLVKEWKRLNKLLFHLSYERSVRETGWEPEVILKELKEAFRYFGSLVEMGELLMLHMGLMEYDVNPMDVLSK